MLVVFLSTLRELRLTIHQESGAEGCLALAVGDGTAVSPLVLPPCPLQPNPHTAGPVVGTESLAPDYWAAPHTPGQREGSRARGQAGLDDHGVAVPDEHGAHLLHSRRSNSEEEILSLTDFYIFII